MFQGANGRMAWIWNTIKAREGGYLDIIKSKDWTLPISSVCSPGSHVSWTSIALDVLTRNSCFDLSHAVCCDRNGHGVEPFRSVKGYLVHNGKL